MIFIIHQIELNLIKIFLILFGSFECYQTERQWVKSWNLDQFKTNVLKENLFFFWRPPWFSFFNVWRGHSVWHFSNFPDVQQKNSPLFFMFYPVVTVKVYICWTRNQIFVTVGRRMKMSYVKFYIFCNDYVIKDNLFYNHNHNHQKQTTRSRIQYFDNFI